MSQHPKFAWNAEQYDHSFRFVSEGGDPLADWLEKYGGAAPQSVLDLGCGTGRLTAKLAQRGFRVLGLDISPEMIARARVNYPEIRFLEGDAADFRLPAAVRWVVSNAALHWMSDHESVLASVYRALQPGGGFLAEMGAAGNLGAIVEAIYPALESCGVHPDAVPLPWYFPTLADYGRLLEQAGFIVRRAETFDRPSPLDDCPNGVSDWVQMFGRPFLDPVPTAMRGAFLEEVARRCAPRLLHDGRWFADYRRLRFLALRPA